MASIPLNTFKTTTSQLTTNFQTIYTAPTGVTTVVLLAQVSNVDAVNQIQASAYFVRGGANTSIIQNTTIPVNDAATLLTGKLILQTGDSFTANCSSNTGGQLILSYLETANQ